MPALYDIKIRLNIDDVIRGQGADPEIIKQRSPRLLPAAAKALEEANTLIKPTLIYKALEVKNSASDQIQLEGGFVLSGEHIKDFLMGSSKIIVAACSISKALQQRVSDIGISDIVYALALDGAGSAAVSEVAMKAYKMFKDNAEKEGLKVTIPLNPGMIGWPVKQGQEQIFNILKSESQDIVINENGVMTPFKSLSFVIGISSQETNNKKTTCDVCAYQGSCVYKKNKRKFESEGSIKCCS